MSDPSCVDWFHGRITRDAAENLLQKTAMVDGTYLLRESTSAVGSYVLSVCKDRKVVHYQIQKQENGMVGINEGPKFPGPVELVTHHKTHLDGLMSLLTMSCNRPAGVKAVAYSDISYEEIEEATRLALRSESIDNEEAVRHFKPHVEHCIGDILHKKQPWFHGIIPRAEADRRLDIQGCEDGLFLIRERGSPRGSYVLGICHKKRVNHYLFEPNARGQLCIKAGRPFDNLMTVVNFYSQKSEGLLCTLKKPCEVSLFEYRPKFELYKNILIHPEIQTELKKYLLKFEVDLKKYKRMSQIDRMKPLPRPPVPRPQNVRNGEPSWKFEKIYDTAKVSKMEGFISPFDRSRERDIKLDPKRLQIHEEIGHGNFGSVMKGIYVMPNNQKLSVAIKTLKEDEIPGQRSEILGEADIMAKLDHPNIVRLVGVTHHPSFMIVMELAPQGPLHKYLKSHRDMPVLNVLILMLQVDEGMHYLEMQHFVHRDLAARNVLVVSENFVKISDFGMSRAMGAGNEYYRAERAGKWPLKWYALECIYYHKFTSKGDVWSYAVTMWEAISYGAKPYQKMNGQAIVDFLENGHRLPKPEKCPDDIYRLMKSCWEKEPNNRPTFYEIGVTLSEHIERERPRKSGIIRV